VCIYIYTHVYIQRDNVWRVSCDDANTTHVSALYVYTCGCVYMLRVSFDDQHRIDLTTNIKTDIIALYPCINMCVCIFVFVCVLCVCMCAMQCAVCVVWLNVQSQICVCEMVYIC